MCNHFRMLFFMRKPLICQANNLACIINQVHSSFPLTPYLQSFLQSQKIGLILYPLFYMVNKKFSQKTKSLDILHAVVYTDNADLWRSINKCRSLLQQVLSRTEMALIRCSVIWSRGFWKRSG